MLSTCELPYLRTCGAQQFLRSALLARRGTPRRGRGRRSNLACRVRFGYFVSEACYEAAGLRTSSLSLCPRSYWLLARPEPHHQPKTTHQRLNFELALPTPGVHLQLLGLPPYMCSVCWRMPACHRRGSSKPGCFRVDGSSRQRGRRAATCATCEANAAGGGGVESAAGDLASSEMHRALPRLCTLHCLRLRDQVISCSSSVEGMSQNLKATELSGLSVQNKVLGHILGSRTIRFFRWDAGCLRKSRASPSSSSPVRHRLGGPSSRR